MLYELQHVTVSLGGETVLNDISLEIRGKEKIAVVGRNGAGKSTLLSLIAGKLEPDASDRYPGTGIRTSRSITVGLLEQNAVSDKEETVQEHILREYLSNRGMQAQRGDQSWQLSDKERYDFEAEYDRLFTGFGFNKEDKQRRMGDFSGGQQTRIAMIRLLLSQPDLLLLDEPTNHLDLEAVEWLERYLRDYRGAVVIVSHDRYFLDRTVNVVLEIRNKRVKRYAGGYTDYKKKKAEDYAILMKRYTEQQEEIQRLEELIKRFRNKPTKAAFARSRMKILERMERVAEPDPLDANVRIPDIQPASGCSKWLVEAEHLKVGYEKELYTIDLRIRRGMKLGVIGPNGIGKSTLLKTIAGKTTALEGELRIGNGVDAAYFDQDSAAIGSELSVADYFRSEYPGIPEKEMRQTLGRFGFPGRYAARKVDELSGGEKSRLVLCMILQRRPNFLILDEPTNHMDVEGMEMLEKVFRAYKGTLILVSHDRYFLNRTTTSLLVFPAVGDVLYYPFDYEHYCSRKEKNDAAERMSAVRTAEEQALIEGLKSVPKGERHMLREIPTEKAYEDWRTRLLLEQVDEAACNLMSAEALRGEERYWTDSEYAQWVEIRIEKAHRRATELYVQWYDLLLEFAADGEG